MKYLKILLVILLPAMLLASCDKNEPDDGTVRVTFTGKVGNEDFNSDEVYTNNLGLKYRVTRSEFYITDLSLIRNDGSLVPVKDVDFINLEEGDPAISYSVETLEGSFKGVRFGMGLDEARNHTDPSTYPQGHPLSIFSGTYWSWAAGYIFMKFEGKVDTVVNGPGILPHPFSYHPGFDVNYQVVTLNNSFTLAKETIYNFDIALDLSKVFEDLNMYEEPVVHSTPETQDLASRVTNNVSGAFRKL